MRKTRYNESCEKILQRCDFVKKLQESIMYKRNVIYVLSVMVLSLFLVGCGGSSNEKETNSAETLKVERSVDLSLAALFAGKVNGNKAPVYTRALKIVTGSLQAYNHTTGITENFSWSAYLNEADFNVTSNKTIVLEPGDYTFTMLLNDTNRQYVGTASMSVTDGSTNIIPLTVSPVIGDTIVDVSVAANLAAYKFSYATSELSALANPQIGITIDGGVEEIFTINPTTGLSQTYLNLSDGAHSIQLALYDGNIQVGKSVAAQESVNVVAGSPLNIDIVALHGATQFSLSETDSNATVKANVPQEVIDEIGIGNLQVIMTLSDGNTTVYENNMSIGVENNTTYATTTFTNMQYGTYNFQLTFNDLSDTSVPVGSCLMENVVLDLNGSTQNCAITLQRRSVLGGNLLATVGINVFNTNNEPVAGASVYANNALIGITGSGSFGTSGYLKTYQVAGNVVFRAEDATNFGEVNTTLTPLSVKNFDITLDTPIVPPFNTAPSYASGKPWKYDFNATGDALNWVEVNGTLPMGQYLPQTAIIGDSIYMFGGYNGGATNVIYKAPLTDPTAWVDTNATLPSALSNSQTAVIGNYVYLFGGYTGSYTNAIYRAPISDPTQWEDTNATLPDSLAISQVVVIGEDIYLFSGHNGVGYTNVIFKASVLDPTNWINTGAVFPTGFGAAQALIVGEDIYMFGGNYLPGTNITNSIYKASTSNPTQWTELTTTLPNNLGLSQAAVIGSYMYLFGGMTDNGLNNVIYRASIYNPTVWEDTTNTLQSSLYGSQIAVIGDYVYLFGGYGELGVTNKIYRAYIK